MAAIAALVTIGVSAMAMGQCIEGDNNGDGVVSGSDLAVVIGNWVTMCVPVIESISPKSALAEGGAEVAITGRLLAAATSVSIGGSDAAIAFPRLPMAWW